MLSRIARRLAALVVIALAPLPAAAQDTQIVRGSQIVERQCARCHSTGRTGPSPLAQAIPFRDISKRYPLSHLEEALAEGIVTGHNEMPRFRFTPDEIDAILGYIASISGQ